MRLTTRDDIAYLDSIDPMGLHVIGMHSPAADVLIGLPLSLVYDMREVGRLAADIVVQRVGRCEIGLSGSGYRVSLGDIWLALERHPALATVRALSPEQVDALLDVARVRALVYWRNSVAPDAEAHLAWEQGRSSRRLVDIPTACRPVASR